YRLVVAVTVLSLITSPLWTNSARRVQHRAARRMNTIGGLLRLIYFREWRYTRRYSRNIYDALYWVMTRIEIPLERVRRRFREEQQRRRARETKSLASQETRDADDA
ncbi:MAG: hypothetical protein VX075_01645, partial [Pseudomonadota bacterium]|nr:hypothetical protein [Pseudomonadota bacterium]